MNSEGRKALCSPTTILLECVKKMVPSREDEAGSKCKEAAGASAQTAYQAVEHSEQGRRRSLVQNRTRSRKHFCYALLAIIMAGCIFRVAVIAFHHPFDWLMSDALRHWENGAPQKPIGFIQVTDPILYQYWIWFFRSILGSSRLGFLIVTSALSLSVPLFWYLFSKEALGDLRYALTSCALVTWWPTLVFNYSYFMTETLLIPLLGAAGWLTCLYLRRPSALLAVISTIAWGLSMHTRTSMAPLGLMSILYMCLKTRRIRYLIPCLQIILILSIPQADRMYQQLGHLNPFAKSPLNELYFALNARTIEVNVQKSGRWIFSSPSFYIKPFSPFLDWSSSRTEKEQYEIGHAPALKTWNAEIEKARIENKEHLYRLHGENMIFILFGHSWPEAHLDSVRGQICLWSRWVWAPLIAINLVAGIVLITRKTADYTSLLVITLLTTLLFNSSGVMEGRYRKPLEPLVIVNTIFLLMRRKQRQSSKFS